MSDDGKPGNKPPGPEVIDPNVDGDWKPSGGTLDATGKVEGYQAPRRHNSLETKVEPPPDPSGLPRLSALKTGDLELMHDPASHARPQYEERDYRDASLQVRSRKKAVLAVLVLLALGIGGFVAVYSSPRLASTLHAYTPRGPLVVSSEPSGAELLISGKKVGTTPWAADNRWVGKTSYEVRLKGYKPAKGAFMGSEETHLDVVLEKAE